MTHQQDYTSGIGGHVEHPATCDSENYGAPATTKTTNHNLHRCLLQHGRRKQAMFSAHTDDIQQAHRDLPNGWGIVIFTRNPTPIVASGHIPPALVHQFTGSQAFIYFLEAWTAICAVRTTTHYSPHHTFSFVTTKHPNMPF